MINLFYNNKSIAGNIGLVYAIAWYTSKGNFVSISNIENGIYYLELNNKLYKFMVQK